MIRSLTFCFFSLFIFQSLVAQFDQNQSIWFTDLEKARLTPERVYQLDLSGQGLTEVPEVLSTMINLEHLKLSDNQLTSIGTVLDNLPKLLFLELSGNKIQNIDFEKWGKLRFSLEELWLRDNRLEKLDSTLSQLKYLRILNLGNNPLTTIDQDVELKNIRQLVADNCQLNEVPTIALRSSKLEYLNLNANVITAFELSTNFRQLRHLNIGDNPLQQFLVRPGKYKLQKLILDWTDLPKLNICNLPGSLEILSLEHCNLKSFPICLTELRKLKELSLIQNYIHNFPPEMNRLTQLEKIWINGNPVDRKNLAGIGSKRLEVIE